MFRRSVVLAVAAVAGRALGQSVPNCDLLGPAYPVPTSLATSPFIIGAANASLAAINTGLTTGRTEFGPIESNVSSFSVAVFSIHDTDSQYLFEHHYLAPAHRNLTTGSRLDGETLYRIGSITKLLTVYTILAKLGDEYWDRHITDFVPQLLASSSGDSSKSVQWEEVTLGDLASHLAGVGRDVAFGDLSVIPGFGQLIGLPALNDSEIIKCGNPRLPSCTLEESLGFFRSHHQVVPAGQTPIYSNVAFQLLAMAYDAITGESFDTAFNTALVKPLSLTRTFLRLPRNDTNALIVEPASDFFPGPWWDFDLGLKAPSGNAYSSTKDLARIGRSILSSTLLPAATTRRWLKPSTHTASTSISLGRPWEIIRQQIPVSPPPPGNSNTTTVHERTVDIFSKAGALGAYEAQFLLSPAHGLGVVVLTASDSVQANTAVLANTLLAEFVPAAEWAARAEAGARYVGVYRPPPDVRLDPSNTNATLALRPGRAGIGVTEFFYNGTDLLEPVLGVPGSSLTALYDLFFATETPLKSTGSGRDVVFRGVVQIGGGGLGNTRPLIFGDQCMYTFGNIDAQRYGGVAADEFVFHVSERAGGGGRNATVTLEVPVLRAGVLEKTSEEA